MNDATRSRKSALASILRAASAGAVLLAMLVTSGCVGVTGKGTPNTTGVAIDVSPSTVSFGDLAVGKSAAHTVSLTNTGTDVLTISAISVAGTGFTAAGPHLPISLSAGQSTSITATFKPSVGEKETGTITIANSAPDSPAMVTLSGQGTTTAELTASPASVAFGSVAVGSEATQTIHVTNTGDSAATISKVAFAGTGISVAGMTAPATLAVGGSTNLTVTYKPVAAGTLAGTVSISSNASDPSVVVNLSATATSSTLSATPASVSFGNVVVGSDTTQSIRLQNIGTSDITISSVSPSVATVAVSGVSTPAKLAPGTSLTFTAAYKPTAAASITGKITVASNAVGSPTIIDLSATAAAAAIQLTPSATSLNFGSVRVGSSGTSQLTVKSTGNKNVTISSVAVSGTGFTLGSSAANLVLDPTQSAAYTVDFDPKAAGSPTGTLTITSNAANSPTKIALSGTAVAASAQHTVALSWDRSSSSVTGYFVYRGSKPSGPYAQLNTSADASPSYSDTTVADGQVYYYVVTAVDSSNIQSAYSNQVSVTIPSN
ncbi:MAG: choice-of-anchor D domain-containing protein [Candidatus Acidiferrales bacterium]